jgi:two-component system LytT family sensor kinase
MVGGYVSGLLAGVLISIPAVVNHELMSLPLFAGVGVLGGLLRDIAPEKEDVWRFSPLFSLAPARLRQRPYQLRLMFQLGCLFTIIFTELLRVSVARVFPKGQVFVGQVWGDSHLVTAIAFYASSVFAVMLPLKIWNNTRNEKKLEAQQLRLNEARLAALTSQINPHFLFNTLNTVSSLIRFDPDSARRVVLKLSNILRRLLRKHETFVPLREELQFIDDYLDIEVARFGRDNLEIVKQIEQDTLEAFVPSMLLQPIVENCLKHGLAPKIGGGKIQFRTANRDGRLHIEIEDNGVGISEEKMPHVYVEGIGLSNVRERLHVLYGADFQLQIESRSGEGTLIRIDVPELVSTMQTVGSLL